MCSSALAGGGIESWQRHGRREMSAGSASLETIPGVTRLSRIAVGGTSTVYRGHQPLFDRPVAVKVLSTPVVADEALRRFQREMAITGRVTGHPHVATVFSSGVTARRHPYLVMEFCPGGSLAARLSRRGAMRWQDASADAVKLCGALATAHANGLVHRDVKPGNVLLDAFNQPKLCDFGIAVLVDAASSDTTAFTYEFAAPEQISGSGVDRRSDVFSMALTLRAMLLGGSPWDSPAHRIPRDLPDEVPSELVSLLDTAISDDPDLRPEDAVALADGLVAALVQAGAPAPDLLLPVADDPADAARPGGLDEERFCADCGRRRGPADAYCADCGYRFRR